MIKILKNFIYILITLFIVVIVIFSFKKNSSPIKEIVINSENKFLDRFQIESLITEKMDKDSIIKNVIQSEIDNIFIKTKNEIKLTGTTLIFIKGINFLIENLIQSMILAFFIISIIMSLLFKNISPSSGIITPDKILTNVDFPAPFGPIRHND